MESAPWFILALLAIYLAFSRLRSIHLNFGDREEHDEHRLRDRGGRRLPLGEKLPTRQLERQVEEGRKRRPRRR